MNPRTKVNARSRGCLPDAGHNQHQDAESTQLRRDQQIILRDGLWEMCSILTACGVSAMAAASGGSIEAIEADLRSAHLALREAVSTFKELRALSVGAAT